MTKMRADYFADIDFALRFIRSLVMDKGISQISLTQDDDDIWVVCYPPKEE